MFKTSLETQLTRALSNNQIDETLRLIQHTSIDINMTLNTTERVYFFSQYMVEKASLQMLQALLDVPCVRSNSMIFSTSIFDNPEKRELVLNHPLIDFNASLQCPHVGRTTPLACAFLYADIPTFKTILNNPKLDVPVDVPVKSLLSLSNSSNGFILDWMNSVQKKNEDFDTGIVFKEKLACLIKHYATLMVYHPQKMMDAFLTTPSFARLLSAYSPSIWSDVKAEVHRLGTAYFDLLNDIDASKQKEASLQHPLYVIFSLYDSNLISSTLNFFSVTKPLLNEISEKIALVKSPAI